MRKKKKKEQNCDTCTRHQTFIKGQTIEGLAEKVGDLRYDTLMEFLDHLHYKIKTDSEKDEEAGRTILANQLKMVSHRLDQARRHAENAWDICKKFMIIKDDKENES